MHHAASVHRHWGLAGSAALALSVCWPVAAQADTLAEAAASPLALAARAVEGQADAPGMVADRTDPSARVARFWRRAEPVAAVGLALGIGDASAGWPAATLRLSALDRQDRSQREGIGLVVGPVRPASGTVQATRLIALRLGFREATPTQAMAAYAGMRRMQGGNHLGVAGSLALSAAAGAVWTTQHEGAKLAVIPAIGSKHIGIGVAASW